jgi:hypothetical protein
VTFSDAGSTPAASTNLAYYRPGETLEILQKPNIAVIGLGLKSQIFPIRRGQQLGHPLPMSGAQ